MKYLLDPNNQNKVSKKQPQHSLNERICRKLFEYIFDTDFPKTKPIWLINERDNRIEFDGYNEKLGIAFEYHGLQHYRQSQLFQKTEEIFLQRLDDDKCKEKMAKENNVKLIIIPYNVKYKNLQKYVIDQCELQGIEIDPEKYVSIDIKKFKNINDISYAQLEKINNFVKKYEGICISTVYINYETPLTFKCKKGHVFDALCKNLQRGYWCNICSITEKGLIYVHKMISQYEGKCTSTEYSNCRQKLDFVCKNNHKFSLTAEQIKNGKWCSEC